MKRRPMSAELRREVLYRDGRHCTRCNGWVSEDTFECHHRKLRSRGGKDTHENLISLCSACHQFVHAFPLVSTMAGWMVPASKEPAAWPVWTFYGTWCVPLDGVWTAVEPDVDQAAPVRRAVHETVEELT